MTALPKVSRRAFGITAASALGLMLAACSSDSTDAGEAGTSGASDAGTSATGPIEVEDNFGTTEVPADPQSIVITDNRAFRAAEAWGVALTAAPRQLVPRGVSYRDDENILDLGSHREPNLEMVVAAEPDLIINGGRFAGQRDAIIDLVGDSVAIVDFSPQDDQPLEDELRRGLRGYGTVLGKSEEAEQLIAEFDAAIERAKAAYKGESVMGILTSGGDISFSAPSTGRAIGPLYDMVGLTPALEASAEDASHGDDISVEAIAQSAPEWMIVLDRDAATNAAEEAGYTPAKDLVENNAALASVPAVQNGRVIYMPANFYTTEDVQAYTEILTAMADAFEAAQ